MALIAGAGFGGGRRPRTPQRWPSTDVTASERAEAARGAAPLAWPEEIRLGRPVYPTQLGARRPQYAPGAAAAQWEHMQRIGMGKENVTINLPVQQQYANWWEQPGAMQPQQPAQPGAAPITPTPWGQTAQPLWEGAGAPMDWLNLRSQDWAAMPREVRSYLETWLRGIGWRPGAGGWGRYGARQWGRAEGAGAAGQYMGEEQFTTVPENMKPWLWWLSGRKGWREGGREAARPATAGWQW